MSTHDLGHGVRIGELTEGCWEVASRKLALPWSLPSGSTPGSAVLWWGEAYQVVARSDHGPGSCFLLRPWPEGEAMRAVFPLVPAWIDSLAAAERSRVRGLRLRLASLPLAPVLALAPRSLQRRWQSEWGFPARGATSLSALAELAAGVVGLIQLLAFAFAGSWFLPGAAWPLVVAGPVMAIEGPIRLASVLGHEQPMGSLIGLPLLLLERRRRSRRATPTGQPGLVRIALITSLAFLAPRDQQERWARRMGVRAIWFTIIGASAELVGGWVNLGRGAHSGEWLPVAVNAFFLVEAVARLALMVSSGRPVGSLLGWPLRPALDRLMPR